MAPLTRIYAQYPGGWKHPRIVTDSPLRYIIPIDPATGVVMISYTDNHDTERFRGLKDKELTAEIQKEVRRLFIKDIIPEPLWVRSAEWKEGATYWRPGNYSPAHMSRAALQPRADMPELYCCGESFSVNQQAWMEGALEHAEQLWTLIQRKR
jgi:monoamine oxidase